MNILKHFMHVLFRVLILWTVLVHYHGSIFLSVYHVHTCISKLYCYANPLRLKWFRDQSDVFAESHCPIIILTILWNGYTDAIERTWNCIPHAVLKLKSILSMDEPEIFIIWEKLIMQGKHSFPFHIDHAGTKHLWWSGSGWVGAELESVCWVKECAVSL